MFKPPNESVVVVMIA